MIERPAGPRRGRGIALALVAVAALVVLSLFVARRVTAPRAPTSSSDVTSASPSRGAARPPLPYPPSPFLNARPELAYVGDEACAPCHQDLVESFHRHGMALSFAAVGEAGGAGAEGEAGTADEPRAARVLGDWSGAGAVHHAPSNYAYTMFERGGQRFVRETRADSAGRVAHEVEKEIAFTIGSGHNDQGFVYEEAGGLYILPVEWYTHEGIWDMAPGFEGPRQERWKRRLLPGCIGCHASYPDYVADSGNRYRNPLPVGIGCERCHGPGALHVAAREVDTERSARSHAGSSAASDTASSVSAGDAFDSTIVNPARLSRAGQVEVCAQCHLQADVRRPRDGRGEFDYRPGLPLSAFKEFYVPEAEDTLVFGFVRHVERMVRSRCYVESATMTCTTCHDPHATSRWRPAAHWAERCLSCHAAEDCPEAAHGGAMGARGAGGADGAPDAHAATDSIVDCVSCHMRRSQPYDLEHVAITDHWIRRRVEPPSTFDETRTRARDDVPLVAFFLDGAPSETTGAFLQGLGMAHVAIGHEEHALPLLDRGLALGPPRSEAHHQRAIANAHLGNRDAALLDLDEAARLGPESAEAAFRLGQTNLEARRPHEAAAAFRAGIALYADDALAWANLGMALAESESLDAALDAARRAVALHPGSDDAQRVLGTVLVALGKLDEAEGPVGEALRLSPDDADAWLARGEIAEARGRREEAVGAWREAARLLPANAEPWRRIAELEEAAERVAEAFVARRAVAERAPRDPRSWMSLGDFLGRAGRFEEAIAAFRRATLLDPRAVAAWGNMALAYTELGDAPRARALLDTVLALDPGNPRALALLERISAGESGRPPAPPATPPPSGAPR